MKKIFLIAAVTLSLNGFAQKVAGNISFPKGKKLEVVTEMKKSNSLEVMGQSMETTVTSTMNEELDIEDANAGGATIEHKVKRLVFNAEGGMMGSQSFDSEKESDRNGDLGKAFDKSLKNKYKMMVDASGRVKQVKLDDDNPNGKMSAEDEQMAQLLSMQLGLNLAVPKAGAQTLFSVLPGREIAQGDTWTDTTSSQKGTRRSATYKVSSITATDVVLDYTEELTVNTTQEMMGQEATINTKDKSSGQITLDRATGLLKKKTSTVDSSGTIEAQGMSIPISGKTSITVTVN
jgi:hypothetical protein